MSPTYFWFGAAAAKTRPIRSANFLPEGSGIVVRTRRRSRSPASPFPPSLGQHVYGSPVHPSGRRR